MVNDWLLTKRHEIDKYLVIGLCEGTSADLTSSRAVSELTNPAVRYAYIGWGCSEWTSRLYPGSPNSRDFRGMITQYQGDFLVSPSCNAFSSNSKAQ